MQEKLEFAMEHYKDDDLESQNFDENLNKNKLCLENFKNYLTCYLLATKPCGKQSHIFPNQKRYCKCKKVQTK